MAISKNAVIFLIVGLVVGVVAGYGVSYTTQQIQISQLHSDLSETQSSLSETTTALSRSQSEVVLLHAQLTEAQNNITSLSTDYEEFTSNVTFLCIQLEKDQVFLEATFKALTTETADSLEETLALWDDVRESSIDVDPIIPQTIDPIMDAVEAIRDWAERVPPINATYEEMYLHTSEGWVLISSYMIYYEMFQQAYIAAIFNHIAAVTELVG